MGQTAWAAAFALAACSVTSSGGGGRGSGPEPGLHLWAPPVVHWEPGSRRSISFAIENATNRIIVMVQPDPSLARVDVYAGADGPRVCGVRPPEGTPTGARPATIELAPGEAVDVRVDLEDACRDVPPGDYRFELSYRAPQAVSAPPGAGRVAFAGQLPTKYGEVIVDVPRSVAARSTGPGRRR